MKYVKILSTFLFVVLYSISFAKYPHLEVNERGVLAWSDTKQEFVIVEANSPENRLMFLDYNQLDILHSFNVNTIYASLNHNEPGANTVYHFWKDINDKSKGFDEEKILQARDYLKYWVDLGNGRNVVHLLLSEQETHFNTNHQEHFDFLKKMVESFGDLPVIWGREEFPERNTVDNNNGESWFAIYSRELRRLDPNNIIAIHNEPRQKPWVGLKGKYENGRSILDLISVQSPINELEGIMRDAFNYGEGQWAVYASEIMPYFEGFQPENVNLALQWYLIASDISSGAGFYYGLKDQSYPNHEPYKDMYAVITNPSLFTVIDNMNPMFWISSPKIEGFDAPEFFEPIDMLSLSSNTFGFWESRYWAQPLPQGVYRLTIKSVGDTVMRVRISRWAFPQVDVLVVNKLREENSMYFYSDGVERLLISIDMLELQESNKVLSVYDINLEKIQ